MAELPNTTRLLEMMRDGAAYKPPKEELRTFLHLLFEERYYQTDWRRFQARPSYMNEEAGASWAGWILSENPSSGPYTGTSFVWFPGEGGSVAVLVIGTGGFGSDGHILGRPGHRRRLQALARLHGDLLWVKPDPLDLVSTIPGISRRDWPDIAAALSSYDRPPGAVIYAAVPVKTGSTKEQEAVEDLMDLFAHEHDVRFKGSVDARWQKRQEDMLAHIFPSCDEDHVAQVLEERRFVVLQGPPGSGKTRLATRIAASYGDPTVVQFHPARTYEDFVIGLSPKPASGGLQFEVKPGDLLRANRRAESGKHVLVIDEINRGDVARVLGEAIFLFEVGEPDRTVELPHEHQDGSRQFRLSSALRVLATLNTADRSIARLDIAIRRRFAFLDIWPDLGVVEKQAVPVAQDCFQDVLATFTEYADEEALNLVPGHAYFLDPRPDLGTERAADRIRTRLRYELVPLLRTYLEDRLVGAASAEIQGLLDRITGRLR